MQLTALFTALALAASPLDGPAADAPAEKPKDALAAPEKSPPPALFPSAQQDAPSASAPSSSGMWAAALLLAVMSIATAYLYRKKVQKGHHHIKIIESAHLGQRRQLVVAELAGETLLLGVSEAGIVLLKQTQPLPHASPEAASASPAEPPAAKSPFNLAALLRRKERPAPPAGPAFDSLLDETAEDMELRRKLSSGKGGRTT